VSFLETDALDIALDDDGDLAVSQSGFRLTSGPDGVAQLCKIAIRLVLGEWFLDQSRGVDWFRILQEKFKADSVSSAIRTALSGVPTVTSVASVRVTPPDPDRGISVSAVVNSVFGDVSVSVAVGGSSG